MIIKPKLSIEIIGKARFYIGLAIGMTILIIHLLNEIFGNIMIREYLDFIEIKFSTYLKIRFFYTLNIAALSISLVVFIWFFNQRWIMIKFRNRNRLALVNIFLLNFIVLFFLIKIPTFYTIFPGMSNIKLLLLLSGLTAFAVFMNSWNNISLIFKTIKWRMLGFAILIVYSSLITLFISFNAS